MTKEIKLTKGKVALVDEEDFDYLNQWKWNLSTSGYARRLKYIRSSGYRTKDNTTEIVTMHRLINNTPEGFFTDHINRNKLDNRKCNLRTVTKSLNGLNRDVTVRNSSGYNGVHFENQTKKWRAEMKIDGIKKSLGRFLNIKDAIFARKKAEQNIVWNIL